MTLNLEVLPLFRYCRMGTVESIELKFEDDGSWLVTAIMPEGELYSSATGFGEVLIDAIDRVTLEVMNDK